jgi:hypothetical protein
VLASKAAISVVTITVFIVNSKGKIGPSSPPSQAGPEWPLNGDGF